jgi:hypothetical protein
MTKSPLCGINTLMSWVTLKKNVSTTLSVYPLGAVHKLRHQGGRVQKYYKKWLRLVTCSGGGGSPPQAENFGGVMCWGKGEGGSKVLEKWLRMVTGRGGGGSDQFLW